MIASASPPVVACRIQVYGVAQGVGFRPFVHRLALRHQVNGWVRNRSGVVELAVEGGPVDLQAFVHALRADAPALSRIDDLVIEETAPEGFDRFAIEASAESPDGRMPVPPDVAFCQSCERELTDPSDRRYRHPFITCTECGPRYSIIEQLPYDRQRTTMRAFTQCAACATEYHSPTDRRYHSETNSCPACGPTLWFEAGAGRPSASGEVALRDAAALLLRGGILAVRGIGGYHLACDATSEAAVAELRQRKRRMAKPFAVLVPTLQAARTIARVGATEAALLTSRERPVVLLQATGGHLAPSVAPGLAAIGVMLPSTPLHLLLLEAVGRTLVMTSGNLSEEPIAIGNDEARQRLAGVADAFLMHDREILSRTDDSVQRVVASGPLLLRRARGYAPLPLTLPVASPVPLLAVGAHLKNSFTLVHGATAWVSPHIGDLEQLEGLEHFHHTLAVYRRLFQVTPQAVVHDLHPGYLSTRMALELGGAPTLAIQHHHAHIAAVMAESGRTAPVIGVAFDGTGYGTDGAIWGGELFTGGLTGFQRVAHLRPAPLPGGDLAVTHPWRTAVGYASLSPDLATATASLFGSIACPEREMALHQIARSLNCPLASSMGRLFDAASAVLGVRLVATYEGQAAMELEALAASRPGSVLPVGIETGADGILELDPVPLLTCLAERRRRGVDVGDLAADFHESVAHATTILVVQLAEESGLTTVALGGGVFQNARFLDGLRARLEQRGLQVLIPRDLPPNDGAISYGQAAIAAALLSAQ